MAASRIFINPVSRTHRANLGDLHGWHAATTNGGGRCPPALERHKALPSISLVI